VTKQEAKKFSRSIEQNRRRFAAARMYCERSALAAAGVPRHPRNHGRILCYHSVGQPNFGVNDVAPKRFRRHIELALSLGYRFVPAGEIARTGGGAKDLALTFDDAAKTVLSEAAPILKEFGAPYTVFAVSEWADHADDWRRREILNWQGLEQLMSMGAELGSHSASHSDFGVIDEAKMRYELEDSRHKFKRHLGFLPETFAIPLGQSRNWNDTASRLAREAGYTTIYAQAEQTRPEGTIARTFVTHFDGDLIFGALLRGAYDRWEEWV